MMANIAFASMFYRFCLLADTGDRPGPLGRTGKDRKSDFGGSQQKIEKVSKKLKSLRIATLAVRHRSRTMQNEKLTLDKSSIYYFDDFIAILIFLQDFYEFRSKYS